MTFEGHLPRELVSNVRSAVLAILGYDAPTRNALLAGLPVAYRGILPGGGAAPAIALTLDLTLLNETERLVDATVPLRVFLRNAIELAGAVAAADDLREALVAVEVSSTGASRVRMTAVDVQEAVVDRNDMVPFGFMTGGVTAARAVAKLQVPRIENGSPVHVGASPVLYRGTGWLLGADLLMTNFHVINARNDGEPAAAESDFRLQAQAMSVQFDYDNASDNPSPVFPTAVIAWDIALDYALVRVDAAGRAALVPAPAALVDVRPDRPVAVNVIQHPDGLPKCFGIRNNLVHDASRSEVRYFTDTLGGSSGSPVLDDNWQVVALHRGAAFARDVTFQGKTAAYVNVGTQLLAILDHLRQTHAGELPELGV